MGDEHPTRSRGLAVFAVRQPSAWRTGIAGPIGEALGVAMSIDKIRSLGLGDVFQGLFQGESLIAHVQSAASARLVDRARRVLRCDLSLPLEALQLEVDAMDIYLEGLSELRRQPSSTRSRCREQLVALTDQVGGELDRAWTMPDLARAAGMSVRTLSSRFQADFGCTLFSFLRERRLLRARDLVADTDMRLGEIAHLVGIATATNFSTALKQRFGAPPVSFRQGSRIDFCRATKVIRRQTKAAP